MFAEKNNEKKEEFHMRNVLLNENEEKMSEVLSLSALSSHQQQNQQQKTKTETISKNNTNDNQTKSKNVKASYANPKSTITPITAIHEGSLRISQSENQIDSNNEITPIGTAYEEMAKWRRNLFSLPKGNIGKKNY